MKKSFIALSVIGSIIICILAVVLPKDPNLNIPSISVMGFDKPLWFAIDIVGIFFYNIILLAIYDKMKERRNNGSVKAR